MRQNTLLAGSMMAVAGLLCSAPPACAQTTVDGYARQGWTVAAVANNLGGDGSDVWLQKAGEGVVLCFVKHDANGSHTAACQPVR